MIDPHPDDILGQRIVNTAAQESVPTATVLREAWAAICTLRADLRTKAATIAALSEDHPEAHPGNRLYAAIVRAAEVYYPKNGCDLDWDVLPATIGRLARERYAARFEVDRLIEVDREYNELRAAHAALRFEHDAWGVLLDAARRDRDEARRERDDYRNLFRDACGSIAHIATAAGFSPTDENVEPPDVASRVANMRAALSKAERERDEAQARLTRLLQPVEGVNLEDALNPPPRPWAQMPWVDVQTALDERPRLASDIVRLTNALDLVCVERDEARRERNLAQTARDATIRALALDAKAQPSEHGIAPDDGRRHNLLLTLTPPLLDRIKALGYVPGETPAGVLPWLVSLAETEAWRRRTP